jgi:hypothetical protein
MGIMKTTFGVVEGIAYLESGVWNIRGVKISDDLVKGWAKGGFPIGTQIELVSREDGVLTFKKVEK